MSEPDYKAMLEEMCAAIDDFCSFKEYVGSAEVWEEMPGDVAEWWRQSSGQAAAAEARERAIRRSAAEARLRDLKHRLANTEAPVASDIEAYIETTQAQAPPGVDARAIVMGEVEHRKWEAAKLREHIANAEAELARLG